MSVQKLHRFLHERGLFLAQLLSFLLIWIFVLIITGWIVNLIALSLELNDVPGASVAISLVAIPVFFTLAGVLTYMWFGMRKDHRRLPPPVNEE